MAERVDRRCRSTPKIEGDRLYGRRGADDGYAIYGSLAALGALQEQGIPHARCVVIIEACEESGSYDLPHYIKGLRERIGTPSLVVCLDSGMSSRDRRDAWIRRMALIEQILSPKGLQ